VSSTAGGEVSAPPVAAMGERSVVRRTGRLARRLPMRPLAAAGYCTFGRICICLVGPRVPATVSRYYPLVTNSVLAAHSAVISCLRVHPPSPFGLTGGGPAVTGRQGGRALASTHRLSEWG